MDIKKAETSSCLSAIRGLRTTLESNKQQETYADMIDSAKFQLAQYYHTP